MQRRVTATAQLQLGALDKTDFDGALERILRLDSRALGVSRASFWSLCRDPPGLHCELGYVAPADALERGAFLRSDEAQSYMRELDRARILEIEDVATDPRARDLGAYCRARNIGAMLDVPVSVDGALAGVLCQEHVGGPRRFAPHEIELALAAGSAIAAALEAKRRVDAEARERRASFLAHASHALCSLDEETVARRAIELALPELGDWAALDLFDGDEVRRAAMTHVACDKKPVVDEYCARFPPRADAPHVTVLGHKLQQAALVPEVTEARLRGFGFSDEHIELLQRLGTKSIIMVPFRNPIVDGVLLFVASTRSFEPDELTLAEMYRDRVASMLTNARLYARSQEALRARDDFLRMASHELRTPLTALQCSCERMRATAQACAPAVVATAERALRSSHRLARLVTHMLDAAKAEAHAPLVQRARVDLVPVVRDAVEDLLDTRRAARIELTLPPALVGDWDDDRVQEIVTNLVDNAIKYGGRAPVDVSLAADGNDAVLTVSDRGVGIAEELIPHLFEPYERARADAAYGGLGLGLFIVRQLVEAHGGHIEVRSRPREGSQFVVRLPGVAA